MENEPEKEYTLTVRLGKIQRRKLSAYAERHRMTLAEVIRCFIMQLPEEEPTGQRSAAAEQQQQREEGQAT